MASLEEQLDSAITSIKRPALHVPSGEAIAGSKSSSRRGSGTIPSPSGGNTPFYSSTNLHEHVPHATKKTIADVLRKYESLFTLTPQRMRMIVDAFEETLEKGLHETGQIVVCFPSNGVLSDA